MAKMLAFTVVAAVTVVVILALRLGQLESPARADQIGDVTWTMSVDPQEPHVGDTAIVSIIPCCFTGSPLMLQKLTITQGDPPALEEVSKESYYGSIVIVRALREGTAQFQLRGAWEKWACYQPPPGTTTPGETPTPYPTMCASNFFYIESPTYTVTVGGAAASTVTPTTTPTVTPAPGNVTWTFDIEPAYPSVGDTVTVTAYPSAPCDQISGQLRPDQPDPPVLQVESQSGTRMWTLSAMHRGEAQLSVFATFECWPCPPPECTSTLVYYLSPAHSVSVLPLAGDDTVGSLDALPVLQFAAGLVPQLPCRDVADVNADCLVDSVDAALILQVEAGLLPQPPWLIPICDFSRTPFAGSICA